MSADMLFPRRFLLASQAEENSRFLRLIFISLLLQFARNTRAAAAGHKQNHQHPQLSLLLAVLEAFLAAKKSGGRTKSSGRKKTPALLLILNTPKAAVEYQRGNEKVTS